MSAWGVGENFLDGGSAGGMKKRAPACCSPAAGVGVRGGHLSLRCLCVAERIVAMFQFLVSTIRPL